MAVHNMHKLMQVMVTGCDNLQHQEWYQAPKNGKGLCMYGYVWLCMAMYAWLCMTMYGYVCMAMYVWLCMCLY